MKAGVLFTGSGPILILTAHKALNDAKLIEKLADKGIKKFVAFEIPEEKTKKIYGNHFNVIMKDQKQTDDLRVLDSDGQRIFLNFSLNELGTPICYDA